MRTHRLRAGIPRDSIYVYGLCANPHPGAAALCAENLRADVHGLYREILEAVAQGRSPIDVYLAHRSSGYGKYDGQYDVADFDRMLKNPNPAMIALVMSNLAMFTPYLYRLSANPAPEAVAFLAANREYIDIRQLSRNSSPDAARLLAEVISELEAPFVANLLFLIQRREDYFYQLSSNPSPELVAIVLARLAADADDAWPRYRALSKNTNPVALAWLAAHPHRIDWNLLSKNTSPAAAALLEASPDRVVWTVLSANASPHLERLMAAHPERLEWETLSANAGPAALALMLAHTEKINWTGLHYNENPAAFALLAARPDKIHWQHLSCGARCPAAFALLATRPAEISWREMLGSPLPEVVDLIFACHPDPGALCWVYLWENPGIFEEVYDYPAMRAATDVHREALAVAAGHPRRLARHLAAGGDPDDF